MNRNDILNWCNRHLPTYKQYELEVLLKDSTVSSQLLRVMGGVFRELQIENEQMLTSWFWDAWSDLKTFTEEEQAILQYYYPLRDLLLTDMQKSHCLTTIFGLPIRIQEVEESHRYDKQAPYLQEGELFEDQVFISQVVNQFLVEVGPIEAIHLPEWKPSGQQRRFLSNGMLPLLLPPNRDVHIKIFSDKHVGHDSTLEVPVYWEQNFQPL